MGARIQAARATVRKVSNGVVETANTAYRGGWWTAHFGGKLTVALVASGPFVAAGVEAANALTRSVKGHDLLVLPGDYLHAKADPLLEGSTVEQVSGLVGEASAASVDVARAATGLGGTVADVVASHFPDHQEAISNAGHTLAGSVVAAAAGGVAMTVLQKTPISHPPSR